jgi:3-deoxy-D-manno-octulosonic-acid transferase
MNAQKFAAAVAVFVAAGSAFAADTAAANGVVLASADTAIAASSLNLASVTINKTSARTRADVRAEAVEFVKNHQTALAIQLEQYKN